MNLIKKIKSLLSFERINPRNCDQMDIPAIQEEIINDFKNFNGSMEKYDYLVKLGKNLPPMAPEYKTEENLIKGCQLTTWFSSNFHGGKVFYNIDSSAVIIRGAIALLTKVLSGQKPADIENADLHFIDQTGLREIFSPLRANSLWKIENRMKQAAVFYKTKSKISKV